MYLESLKRTLEHLKGREADIEEQIEYYRKQVAENHLTRAQGHSFVRLYCQLLETVRSAINATKKEIEKQEKKRSHRQGHSSGRGGRDPGKDKDGGGPGL